MKKAPVVIKGNKSGIRIVLDDALPFPEILEEVGKKFKESSDFLGEAQVAVSFDGRKLTEEQEAILLECIKENSKLQVVCLIDEDKQREELFNQTLNEKLMAMNANSGQFFKGNLRSGQVMEFETSVVILGDINVGAQVWNSVCRSCRKRKCVYCCIENESDADTNQRCNRPFL